MLSDSGEYLFTCKDCGSHNLYVIKRYTMTSKFRYADYERLMAYEGRLFEDFEQDGEIDYDHRFFWMHPHSSGYYEDDENWYEIDEGDLSDYPEEKTYDEPELDEDSEEYFVYCSICKREIEFGWTEPNQKGRIWPIEASDFIPGEGFPEPRYEKIWEERGWL